MPSVHAATRIAPIAADRRSAGSQADAGGQPASARDVFAALMGEMTPVAPETGVASARRAGEPETADPARTTQGAETALAALAGGAVVVPPPIQVGLQTAAGETVAVENATEADLDGLAAGPLGGRVVPDPTPKPPPATASTTATGAAGVVSGDAQTGSVAPPPVAASTVASPPVPTSATPVPQAAAAVTATGVPSVVVEMAALSAVNAAASAIVGALGGETAGVDALAVLAQQQQGSALQAGAQRARGQSPARLGSQAQIAGASVTVQGATSANLVPVAGGQAAFDVNAGNQPPPVDAGAPPPVFNGSNMNAVTGVRIRSEPTGFPIMTAALGFAQRMQADLEANEAQGDASVAGLTSSTQRLETASVSATPPPTTSSAREVAVPLPLLATEIARQAERGRKQFDIRLDPPELGKVRVKLDLGQEGEVRAHLIVERKETLDMLQRDQRVLERALQGAGLDLAGGGLQFSLSGGGQERFGQGEGAGQGQARSRAAREAETETAAAPPPPIARGRPGGLDLRI